MLVILPRVAHATMSPAQFASKPIGTGPYVVSDFKAGRGVELTRNSGYYQADWGVPRFDRIKILSIPDPQTLTSELSSGRVDFVWGVSPDNMALLKGNKGITTVTGGSNTFSFLSLDSSGRTGPNPLQDKNVRLAIAHAINRPAISQVLRGPGSSVINAPCHPLQFGCVSSLGTPTYDLKKAKAFMKASAYPNGFDLTVSSFTEGGPVAEASAIGIKGKVDQRETSAWVKDFFGGKLRAAVVPWPSAGVRDAAAAVNVFFTGGQGDYTRDQEVMDAFKSAGTLAKPAQRELLYRKGFEKISREMPVVPLMTNVANYAYRTGLDMTPPADGYPLAYLMGWKK
jgi:peptide/nickel transport system substrate-binding protein